MKTNKKARNPQNPNTTLKATRTYTLEIGCCKTERVALFLATKKASTLKSITSESDERKGGKCLRCGKKLSEYEVALCNDCEEGV